MHTERMIQQMGQRGKQWKLERQPRTQNMGVVFLVLLLGMAAMVYSQTTPTIVPTGVTVKPIVLGPVPVFDKTLVLFCNFNASTKCTTKNGYVNPIKSNFVMTTGGINNTKGALINEKGSVGLYPNTGLDLSKGTIEAWINPNTGSTRRQYLFSMMGGKSLDGDAYNDLVFGETGSANSPNTSYVFFGGTDGVNTQNPLSFPSHIVRAISAGDIDEDGSIDLAISNNGANEIWLFDNLQPGQTLSGPSPINRISVPQPQGSTLAYLDGDEHLDLVVASYDPLTPPIYLWKGNGNGTFTPWPTTFGPFVTSAEGIDAVDVDKDGVLDIIFGSFTIDPFKPSMVLYGQITPQGDYTVGIVSPTDYQVLDNGILGLQAEDLDQDGWEDVVLAQTFGNQLIVWMNDGTGHFPNDPQHRFTLSTSRPFTVAIRDMDNDGHLDIGTANYKPSAFTDNNSSTFFRGPDFTNTIKYPVENAVSVSVGNMDGDGLNDIAYHSSTGGICPVYYLNKDGIIQYTLHISNPFCQPTWGNPSGPGSGVAAAVKGSTPYGRNTIHPNEMELYYDSADGKVHFVMMDTLGNKHEASTAFAPNGSMQKVKVVWNGEKIKITVGNPTQGGTTMTYTAQSPILLENAPAIYSIGTGQNNQYSLNGMMDDFRIYNVVKGTI